MRIEVLLNSDDPNSFERLKLWAQKRGDVHLSTNTFKHHGEVSTVMLTYRNDKQTMEFFKKEVQLIREQLDSAGFALNGKEILEYCLYDSSTSHDNEWLFGKAG